MGLSEFLLGAVAAMVATIGCQELKAWTPRIVRVLINKSVALLPTELRGRMREEWQSHVEDLPGDVWRIWTAFGFLIAARRMTNAVPVLHQAAAAALIIFFLPLAPTIALIGVVSNSRVRITRHQTKFFGQIVPAAYHVRSERVLDRFLRRSGWDQLPILFNIARGECRIPDWKAFAKAWRDGEDLDDQVG